VKNEYYLVGVHLRFSNIWYGLISMLCIWWTVKYLFIVLHEQVYIVLYYTVVILLPCQKEIIYIFIFKIIETEKIYIDITYKKLFVVVNEYIKYIIISSMTWLVLPCMPSWRLPTQ